MNLCKSVVLLLLVLVLGTSVVAASNITQHNKTVSPMNCTCVAIEEELDAELTWEGIVVMVTIVVMILCMAFNLVGSTAALFLVSLFFTLCGIITDKQLFSGLVNKGMLSIALLFVIVHPLADLPVAHRVITFLLSSEAGGSRLLPLAKLSLFSWATSPLLENVPHAAVLTPIVTRVCRELGIHPQQMLMSMAFSICSSNWLILASASNLIVESIVEENNDGGIGFFELAKTNLVVSFVLQAYFILMPQFIFSETTASTNSTTNTDDGILDNFTTVMQIPTGNPFIERSIRDLFKSLPDDLLSKVQVVAICREDIGDMRDPDENELLQVGDELILSGELADLRSFRLIVGFFWVGISSDAEGSGAGLVRADSASVTPRATTVPTQVATPAKDEKESTNEPINDDQEMEILPPKRKASEIHRPAQVEGMSVVESTHQSRLATFTQVVVSAMCPAVDSRVGSRQFSNMYQATIVAMRSVNGDHIVGEQLVRHTIETGDTLLLRTKGDGFLDSWRDSDHFYLVEAKESKLAERLQENYAQVPQWFCWGHTVKPSNNKYVKLPDWYPNLAMAVFVGVVAAAMAGVKLTIAAAVAICVLVFSGLVTVRKAISFVDWGVYITGSFAFGIGHAMTESGLAQWIGKLLVDAGVEGFWLLLLLAFLTSLVANIVSNRGAIQVMYPIARSIFKAKGLDMLPAAVVIANGAMGGFLTPYGLSPSLIIAGPGKYTPSHFLKFGTPLLILYTVLSAVMTAAVYDMW